MSEWRFSTSTSRGGNDYLNTQVHYNFLDAAVKILHGVSWGHEGERPRSFVEITAAVSRRQGSLDCVLETPFCGKEWRRQSGLVSREHQGTHALLTAAAGLRGLGRSRRHEAAVRSWGAFYEKRGLLFPSGLQGGAPEGL